MPKDRSGKMPAGPVTLRGRCSKASHLQRCSTAETAPLLMASHQIDPGQKESEDLLGKQYGSFPAHPSFWCFPYLLIWTDSF